MPEAALPTKTSTPASTRPGATGQANRDCPSSAHGSHDARLRHRRHRGLPHVPHPGTVRARMYDMAIRRQRLAERRKAVGYTQEQLAEQLGVERTTVARWEAGATAPQPWQRPNL